MVLHLKFVFMYSLLIYRHAIDFGVLDPMTSLVSSGRFFLLVAFLGFFYIDNHVICKERNSYFFLFDLHVFHFLFLPYCSC